MPEDIARPDAEPGSPVVIKKYANRRLYNTGASTYVTLDHLAEMVRNGQDFVVYDARTNEDITRQVLTQIIFEEETRGENLLPIQFLRQLIKLYGAQMQGLAPTYLEMSLDAFAKQQHLFQEQAAAALGGGAANPAMKMFEEQVRRNMGLFAEAMKVWAPGMAAATAAATAPPKPPPEPAPAAAGDDLAALREQMAAMQAQLAKLAEKGG